MLRQPSPESCVRRASQRHHFPPCHVAYAGMFRQHHAYCACPLPCRQASYVRLLLWHVHCYAPRQWRLEGSYGAQQCGLARAVAAYQARHRSRWQLCCQVLCHGFAAVAYGDVVKMKHCTARLYFFSSSIIGMQRPVIFPFFIFRLYGIVVIPSAFTSGESHIRVSHTVVSISALFDFSVFRHIFLSGSRQMVSTLSIFAESAENCLLEASCLSTLQLS